MTLILGAGLLAAAASAFAQEPSSPPGPCPADDGLPSPPATVRDDLLAADLAAASRDEARSADLLAEAAGRASAALAPGDWLALARREESRGDFAAATARYGQYVKTAEGTGEDTRWLGPRLKLLGIAAQRSDSATRALSPEAQLALADSQSALARGDVRAAREKLDRAIRLDARQPEAWIAVGALDARQGHVNDAVREYRSALALDPDRVEAMVPLANLLWDSADRAAKAESLLLLDRAVEARPDIPSLQRRSAERWAAWGDAKSALERLDAFRSVASPAERQSTDRLREALVAKLPKGVDTAPAANRAGASLPRRAGSRPSRAAASSSSAPESGSGLGAWIWGVGAVVLAAAFAGALSALGRRRRTVRAPEVIPEAAVSTVSVEALRKLLERAAAERAMPVPAFASKGFPEGDQNPWVVQVPERAWDTLWRAIFANTLAGLQAAQGVVPRVALFGSLVRDAKVAGVAGSVVRLVLADNAPGVLTTEMLREHKAGESWNVVDQILRAHGGSIAVAPSIDRHYAKRLLIELHTSN